MTGNPFDFLVCILHRLSPNIPLLLPFFSSVRSGGSSTDSVCLLCGRRGIFSGSGARYRHRNKRRPASVMLADPMKRSSHPWIASSALLSRGATTFPADIAATQYGIITGWRKKSAVRWRHCCEQSKFHFGELSLTVHLFLQLLFCDVFCPM